jgi:hypothetical protein
MDIATITSELMPALHQALPYLLKMGGKAAEEASKNIGADSWTFAKKLWGKLFPAAGQDPGVMTSMNEAAAEPDNGDRKDLLQLQFKRLLTNDPELAASLEPLVDEYRQMINGNNNQVAGGSIVHNEIDFRRSHFASGVIINPGSIGTVNQTFNAPTVKELEQKDDRSKILNLLAQFDRKAVNDAMHEENIAWMVTSLNELRVNLQMLGSSSVLDQEIRLLFSLMRDDIEKIVNISKFIYEAGQPQGWQNSIFDFRAMGMAVNNPSIYSYYNRSTGQGLFQRINQFIYHKLYYKYQHAKNIDSAKVPKDWPAVEQAARERGVDPSAVKALIAGELPASIPLDIQGLSADASILYLFGMIDQLKDSIGEKAGMIRKKLAW